VFNQQKISSKSTKLLFQKAMRNSSSRLTIALEVQKSLSLNHSPISWKTNTSTRTQNHNSERSLPLFKFQMKEPLNTLLESGQTTKQKALKKTFLIFTLRPELLKLIANWTQSTWKNMTFRTKDKSTINTQQINDL